MFFGLKKKIMSRAIAKRNKQYPFDYNYAEDFSLDGETDTLLNNSYYFSAHDENMSFFARLGRRTDKEETWFVIRLDGQLYSLDKEIFPQGASPIRVEKRNGLWTITYEGKFNEQDQITFRAAFTPKQQPIDFTSNMPAERMATGVANEHWNKQFFSELQNISGQCHYEQEGELNGSMTLNGKTTEFHLPCVRDHSFGKRDWNYMNNHLWLMAVSASRQFNYSMVSYPVMSVLEVGNYRDNTGQHYMLQANLDLQTVSDGSIPQELSLQMLLDNGKQVSVQVKKLTGVTYHFQNGQYILHENIADFLIDGNPCRGILEIGFNCDSNRYFNQRNLNTIQR